MKKIIVLMFLGFLFVQGCATTESIRKLEKQGSARSYSESYEKIWEAALFSCGQHGLVIKETEKERGYISAHKPLRAESWGEVVGIWINKKQANTVEVRVVSRRVGPALFFWYNWEKPILDSIETYLKLKDPTL